MAGLAILIRVSMVLFGSTELLAKPWHELLFWLSTLTMFVGNISAIGQVSVKRLLAFSSVGHVGMMLMGALVMNQVGASNILFYMLTYVFMTLVAFAIVAHVSNHYGSDSKVVFKGLIKKNPLLAILMIITLFSLAGLPPLSGFVAKFNIISGAVEAKEYAIAFIAAINSVIALYYYMVLIKSMVFEQGFKEEVLSSASFKHRVAAVALTLPIFILGIFWDKIMAMTDGASIFLN